MDYEPWPLPCSKSDRRYSFGETVRTWSDYLKVRVVTKTYLDGGSFHMVNGHFKILNWRYVSTIFLAIVCGDIPLHRPEK